jgi:hypothetical protein
MTWALPLPGKPGADLPLPAAKGTPPPKVVVGETGDLNEHHTHNAGILP